MSDNADTHEHVLLVGFGGPTNECCGRYETCPGTAACFVAGIFGHNEARRARIDEVTEHYKHFDGVSRFNEETARQGLALQAELQKRGVNARVWCGYHHWMPYVRDTMREMQSAGVKEFTVVVMSPHQCSVSWDAYLRLVGEGVAAIGEGAPQPVAVAEPWWNQPGFIRAIADRIRTCASSEGVDLGLPTTGICFSAHAIPESVSRTAPYCRQIEETAKLVAEELGGITWRLGYQSQPSDSRIPWTGPSLEGAIDQLAEAGCSTQIGSAIGFLCDNVEVLFDLGVEGAEHASAKGIRFLRAESVHDHHAFIEMLADRVLDARSQTSAS